MVVTKDIVKQEIDRLPDDVIEQIYVFLHTIQVKERRKPRIKRQIRTFKLHGQFDRVNIRELAYE